MDFELTFTAEQESFRAEVRSWLEEHAPKEMEHPADPGLLTLAGYRKQRQLGRALGAKGWLYPTYPSKYCGGGLSGEEALIIEQELDRHGFTLPPYYDSGGKLGAASIMVWGTEEQKASFPASHIPRRSANVAAVDGAGGRFRSRQRKDDGPSRWR